jgi:hypothetical protein
MLVVVPRVRRLVRDGRIASATILDRWEHVSLSMAARSPAASLLIALLQARSNNFCLFTTYLFMTTDLFTLIYGQHRAFYLAQHDYC